MIQRLNQPMSAPLRFGDLGNGASFKFQRNPVPGDPSLDGCVAIKQTAASAWFRQTGDWVRRINEREPVVLLEGAQ